MAGEKLSSCAPLRYRFGTFHNGPLDLLIFLWCDDWFGVLLYLVDIVKGPKYSVIKIQRSPNSFRILRRTSSTYMCRTKIVQSFACVSIWTFFAANLKIKKKNMVRIGTMIFTTTEKEISLKQKLQF